MRSSMVKLEVRTQDYSLGLMFCGHHPLISPARGDRTRYRTEVSYPGGSDRKPVMRRWFKNAIM